jgi:16S rRNA G966 N2-methylase RsmD
VHCRDTLDHLRLTAGVRRFDLVLADPPYDSALAVGTALSELLPDVLHPNAFIVTESHKRNPLELPFPIVRERIYGTTRVVIHRNGG